MLVADTPDRLIAAGGHAALLAALSRFPDNAQLFAAACSALMRAADESSLVGALLSASAAEVVAEGASRFILLSAATSSEGATAAEVAAASAAADARTVSSSKGTDCHGACAAATAGLLALRSLAAADPRRLMSTVVATAAAGAAAAAASLCERDANFAIACCGLTRNLAVVPEQRSALLSAGCAASANTALAAATLGRLGDRAGAVIAAAGGALFGLACEPSMVPELVGAGSGALACGAMRLVDGDAAAAWALCGLLYKIASAAKAAGNTGCLQRLQEDGAGAAVAKAVQLHVTDSRVARAACAALAALA